MEQEIDSLISAAIARLNALSKSADRREIAGAKLDLGELWLKKGIATSDRAAFQSAIEYSQQGLGFVEEHNSFLSATLREVRGVALCRLYEIDGDLSLLSEGVADLRSSWAVLRQNKSGTAWRATG